GHPRPDGAAAHEAHQVEEGEGRRPARKEVREGRRDVLAFPGGALDRNPRRTLEALRGDRERYLALELAVAEHDVDTAIADRGPHLVPLALERRELRLEALRPQVGREDRAPERGRSYRRLRRQGGAGAEWIV